MKQRFNSFSELAHHKKEGEHYDIVVKENSHSHVSIVAPHGGNIEWNTSKIAKDIAANDHNLYLFEAKEAENCFYEMHVTSNQFDEPRCLELISLTDTTLTIHGCRGDEPVVYIGGRDEKLKKSLADAFNKHNIKALTEGHIYKGSSPENICNRNQRGEGVQLEFSRGIRDNPDLIDKCVGIIRRQINV